jgi:hypothetical protein
MHIGDTQPGNLRDAQAVATHQGQDRPVADRRRSVALGRCQQWAQAVQGQVLDPLRALCLVPGCAQAGRRVVSPQAVPGRARSLPRIAA